MAQKHTEPNYRSLTIIDWGKDGIEVILAKQRLEQHVTELDDPRYNRYPRIKAYNERCIQELIQIIQTEQA